MPRSRSIPSRDYDAGVYGPFDLDGFTKGNTEELVLSLSIENWPDIDPLVTVRVRWDNGDGADAAFSGGVHYDKAGQVVTHATLVVSIPRSGSGKADVTAGSVNF